MTTTPTYAEEAQMTSTILTITNPATGTGISPFAPDSDRTVAQFVRILDEAGATVVTDSRTSRPWNHHVIGVGGGHQDADFAERGRSFCAWVENDARSEMPGAERIEGIKIAQKEATR